MMVDMNSDHNDNKYRGHRKLAIDVGGVLIAKKHEDGADTNFDESNVKWLDGALAAVESLSANHELYVLSFCGKKTEMETRRALGAVKHIIPEERWIFTRKREHKVREMKNRAIPTLIDDREDIIRSVREQGLQGIHFGSGETPDWLAVVQWLESRKTEGV
jgi:hypothetical protein